MDNFRRYSNLIDMKVEQDTWYVAWLGEIVHHGFCPAGTELNIGLPDYKIFDNEKEYKQMLLDMGVEPQ
jgi:hypothetical protein